MSQEKVIPLYPGAAPGSEVWTQQEKENRTNMWQTRVVFNVARPTLTVFEPQPPQANGTALVICPGGAFFALSIDSEGFDVARWMAAKGVTCFKEYNLNPNRIGIIGFSAGGTVAASVAFNYTPKSRPDFAAPIYLQYEWTPKPNGVPSDAPPMFILAASDDQLGLAPHSVALYKDWTAAKKPAELHLYAKGGHGFGMRKQNLPTDHWIERFADWLDVQGLMKK